MSAEPNMGSILIVDDDPGVRLNASRLLKRNGYEVFEAANGEDCLRMLEMNRPDMILLDVVLPDISGLEICNRIKSNPENTDLVIVLISSTLTSTVHRQDGLALGADFYLSRPISNNDLLTNVSSILKICHTQKVLRRENTKLKAENRKLKAEMGRNRLSSADSEPE